MQSKDGRDERSLGDLFAELAKETSALVRHEVTLAKTEMSEKASQAGKHVGVLAAGGALAYAGLLAVLAGIIVLLGQVMPMWLSALIVGAVVIVVGYLLVKKGLDALKREDFAPRQTMETLKEDQQWAKDQTK